MRATSVALVVLAIGCAGSHSAGDLDDASIADASRPPADAAHARDGARAIDADHASPIDAARLLDSAPPRDAPTSFDTGTDSAPPLLDAGDPQRPLTDEEAACLGLDEPSCAGCHRRSGVWYLLPAGVPAPPPDLPPADYSGCGVAPP